MKMGKTGAVMDAGLGRAGGVGAGRGDDGDSVLKYLTQTSTRGKTPSKHINEFIAIETHIQNLLTELQDRIIINWGTYSQSQSKWLVKGDLINRVYNEILRHKQDIRNILVDKNTRDNFCRLLSDLANTSKRTPTPMSGSIPRKESLSDLLSATVDRIKVVSESALLLP